MLRILFTLFKEKKDGHRISLQEGDHWLQDLLRRHRSVATARGRRPARTIAPSSWRAAARPAHRRASSASIATTWRPACSSTSGRSPQSGRGSMSSCCRCRCSTSTRNVGVQPLAFIGPNPLSLVPNPRDIDDLLKTISQVKPAFFNGVPTLYTAILNHPRCARGQSRSQLDQIVLLRRGGADGGNEAAVRGAHRRTDRRGLLADGRDDGVLRQPRAGDQQARIDRRAAAGRRSPHRRRRDAEREMPTGRSRRDASARAAAHGRGTGTTPPRPQRRCARMVRRRTRGCTPATSRTWTTTASSSSSTARRT